jgi:pimeloyl-ACP methyl ester carboxylesterase
MGASPTAADELRALTRLAFDELGGASAGIGQMHRAIADRAFGATGAASAPSKALHDGISGAVYASLRSAAGLAGKAAGGALEGPAERAGRPLSTTPRGAALLGAINGLIGDRLERQNSPLRQPMAVRVGERVVAPAELAAAFPDATPRIVVFVHGLFETEHAWRYGGGPSYGAPLRRELGCTPVEVRFNSGRHVSENGRSLADLLADVVAAWPVEVEEVALVGHSMGGLVARSACHTASERGDRWVRLVRHAVTLGTPHTGAPVEQAIQVASAALGALPETRPFAGLLRRRSAGIRDLRQGSLVDEDWRDRDPDALRAAACREVPLLDGATHHFVAATVTRGAEHPVGRLVGDWLVLYPSACGRSRTRRIPFRVEDGLHVGGTHHLALLNHPQVYARLREWLATAPRPAEPATRPPARARAS